MLSLHALLFFILGSSVFAHPVRDPSPDPDPSEVGQRLQTLLKGQGLGGKTTWIRKVSDKYSKDRRDDVITFDPPKLPQIGTLREKPGEFSKGDYVQGDLKQVLNQIKGTWTLRPDSMNAHQRLYMLTINPDQPESIQLQSPIPWLIRTATVEQYDFSNVNVPFPERIIGWWYRIPPMGEDNKNDVIFFHPDKSRVWYQLNQEGKITKISTITDPRQERDRLLGFWARMLHVSDLL
ncbi:hypothetical protein AX14_000533 [Amanita brunnescens Koide BX004]|nr:hypothetical protein AX14_000533 [Amanita brunnescens Koide BX004]